MAKRVIIGESGGPTPVIDWEVAGALSQAQEAGWEVYGMRNGLEGLLNANIPGNERCDQLAKQAAMSNELTPDEIFEKEYVKNAT